MRKDIIENVEIVDPPIGELSKKRGGFLKRTCLTGCGCVFLFLILLVVVIRLAIGPGPKETKNLPPNFPKEIPLYDQDSIKQITFIRGEHKSRRLAVATIVPKLMLSPILDPTIEEATGNSPEKNATWLEEQTKAAKKIWELIRAPVSDKRDTVQIEWEKISAEPTFVVSYYQNELRKNGYTVKLITDEVEHWEYSFSNEKGVSGVFSVRDAYANKTGTDYALLTVNFTK